MEYSSVQTPKCGILGSNIALVNWIRTWTWKKNVEVKLSCDHRSVVANKTFEKRGGKNQSQDLFSTNAVVGKTKMEIFSLFFRSFLRWLSCIFMFHGCWDSGKISLHNFLLVTFCKIINHPERLIHLASYYASFLLIYQIGIQHFSVKLSNSS